MFLLKIHITSNTLHMTLFTDPHIHKIVTFGFNLVYPRNHYISGAASFAAWYGRNWSITRTPCYLPDIMSRLFSRGINGVIEETLGFRNVTYTWSDTFSNLILPFWYPDYVVPYYPYIHNTIAISAAVSVSLILNLLAQAFFGIRSDKQKQNEPIETALGIPDIPQQIQNIITTENPAVRSQTTPVMNQNVAQNRPLATALEIPNISQPVRSDTTTVNQSTLPEPIHVMDQSIVLPVHDHAENQTSEDQIAEKMIKSTTAESSQIPSSKPDPILPTAKSSEESKELLFDQEEYRKYATEQACCWNPLNIMKITFC